MGVVPGGCLHVDTGLRLAPFSSEPAAHHFIHSLHPICEILFNLLLIGYITSLKAFCDYTSQHGEQEKLDGWDKAIRFAEVALEKSQDAEVLRQNNSIVDADSTTEAAFKALKLRYNVCQ